MANSLFPIIVPPKPVELETPQPQQVETAQGYSSDVAELAAMGGHYQNDLALADPTLQDANLKLADKTQAVVTLEETDRLLGEQIGLDERALKAKTGIHEKLSKHQQFLAQNAVQLQQINMAHVLGTSGLQAQQQQQAAKYNGIVAARAAIARRMNGGGAT